MRQIGMASRIAHANTIWCESLTWHAHTSQADLLGNQADRRIKQQEDKEEDKEEERKKGRTSISDAGLGVSISMRMPLSY